MGAVQETLEGVHVVKVGNRPSPFATLQRSIMNQYSRNRNLLIIYERITYLEDMCSQNWWQLYKNLQILDYNICWALLDQDIRQSFILDQQIRI